MPVAVGPLSRSPQRGGRQQADAPYGVPVGRKRRRNKEAGGLTMDLGMDILKLCLSSR